MLPTGTGVQEDSVPRPPHWHVVFYSFSVCSQGSWRVCRGFAFLEEWVRLYLTVHAARFSRVSGGNMASPLQKWVVVWLLKSSRGLCASCILWELEKALPLHSHSLAPGVS